MALRLNAFYIAIGGREFYLLFSLRGAKIVADFLHK